VIQEAYVQGISTRSAYELVKALGMEGISKSQVSRLCGETDERVGAFLTRPIEGDWPDVWLDATSMKVRRDHHIVSVAVIVAVGVNTDGRREVLGMTVGSTAQALRPRQRDLLPLRKGEIAPRGRPREPWQVRWRHPARLAEPPGPDRLRYPDLHCRVLARQTGRDKCPKPPPVLPSRHRRPFRRPRPSVTLLLAAALLPVPCVTQ